MVRKPLVREICLDKSINELYQCIVDLPFSFLLDSSLSTAGGRYSFLGADPFAVIYSKSGLTYIRQCLGNTFETSTFKGNPFEAMSKIFKSLPTLEPLDGIPFSGGGVGFLSYDLGRQLERVPEFAVDDLETPDIVFGLYDVLIAVENSTGRKTIISSGHPERAEEKVKKRAEQRADWLWSRISTKQVEEKPWVTKGPVNVQANFNKKSYLENVARAIEHILSGDIFQVNLSQRFALESNVSSWQLYKDLKRINPAPFAAHLNFEDIEVICSSPERFLLLDRNKRVETCPIKGTRPRGKTPSEDLHNYNELLNSCKDKAELTMIVDLERSDLGKVCRIGSIKTEMPFQIEEFPTVFHLVATVVGQLNQAKDIFDLLNASFPGGSITGAPKIKAMELIESLEPVRRGIYTGSLGYIGFDGTADLNIVIRTIVKAGGKYYFQVGGGITAQSKPEDEYNETLDKARALLRALKFEGSIYDGPYVG